jgi:hypothetical protein
MAATVKGAAIGISIRANMGINYRFVGKPEVVFVFQLVWANQKQLPPVRRVKLHYCNSCDGIRLE